MNSLHFEISELDILNGEVNRESPNYNINTDCVLALAIKRKLGVSNVEVGYKFLFINEVRYLTDSIAKDIINRDDSGWELQPKTFTIYLDKPGDHSYAN